MFLILNLGCCISRFLVGSPYMGYQCRPAWGGGGGNSKKTKTRQLRSILRLIKEKPSHREEYEIPLQTESEHDTS